MPDDAQEIFDHVWVDGMTQAEAAEVLGVSAVKLKRRLSRVPRLLIEQLANLCPGEKPPGAV